jgi:hypothetical protein
LLNCTRPGASGPSAGRGTLRAPAAEIGTRTIREQQPTERLEAVEVGGLRRLSDQRDARNLGQRSLAEQVVVRDTRRSSSAVCLLASTDAPTMVPKIRIHHGSVSAVCLVMRLRISGPHGERRRDRREHGVRRWMSAEALHIPYENRLGVARLEAGEHRVGLWRRDLSATKSAASAALHLAQIERFVFRILESRFGEALDQLAQRRLERPPAASDRRC